jgi:hypothetical protein
MTRIVASDEPLHGLLTNLKVVVVALMSPLCKSELAKAARSQELHRREVSRECQLVFGQLAQPLNPSAMLMVQSHIGRFTYRTFDSTAAPI